MPKSLLVLRENHLQTFLQKIYLEKGRAAVGPEEDTVGAAL